MLQKNFKQIIITIFALNLTIVPLTVELQNHAQLSQKIIPKKAVVKLVPNQIEPVKEPTIVNIQTEQKINQPTPIKKASSKLLVQLDEKEFKYFVHVIHAEAGGEPFEGQVAVGAVLLNRIRSGEFPKNLTANIFRRGEFESVSNGHIWSEPNASAYHAAELALKGWDPTNGALYFFNPAKSSSHWIWTRVVTHKIGQHWFAV